MCLCACVRVLVCHVLLCILLLFIVVVVVVCMCVYVFVSNKKRGECENPNASTKIIGSRGEHTRAEGDRDSERRETHTDLRTHGHRGRPTGERERHQSNNNSRISQLGAVANSRD